MGWEIKDEKIILISIIGTLEAVKQQKLTIDEAEKFLFSPHMVTKMKEKWIGIPLYKVANSKYCQRLIGESVGFYTEFSHYAIITINDIVDIISTDEPQISVIKLC